MSERAGLSGPQRPGQAQAVPVEAGRNSSGAGQHRRRDGEPFPVAGRSAAHRGRAHHQRPGRLGPRQALEGRRRPRPPLPRSP